MSQQSVDVDVVVDEVGAGDGPPSPSPPRRRVGLAVLVVAAVVVTLLAWPDGSEPPVAPVEGEAASGAASAPDDPRLLPWPARGDGAADAELLTLAADAWRTQASVSAPGDVPDGQVYPLWAGSVGSTAVAVLQAVGVDGLVRVAQVSESRRPSDVQRGPLVLTTVQTVTGEPEMLLLSYAGGLDLGYVLDQPGRTLMQVLPAPGLLPDGVELQRRDGARFVPLAVQPDGLSEPWVHSVREGPGTEVAAVRVRGADPGILTTRLLVPGQMTPAPPPVQLVPAEWGSTSRGAPEHYVDARAALEALGRSGGRVAVLGSTPLPGARATLLEVRPEGPGTPVVMAVHAVGERRTVSPPQPARLPTEVALGAVRLAGGALVVVAAGPPGTSLVVLGADGAPVGTGPRTAAVVLDPGDAVGEVAAQGYRDDQSLVGRSVLDVREG